MSNNKKSPSSKRRTKKQNDDEASDSLLRESSHPSSSDDGPSAPLSSSPVPHTRSLHSIHSQDHQIYVGGCIQFAPSLKHDEFSQPAATTAVPLQRTLSTPEPTTTTIKHENSAFYNFRSRIAACHGRRHDGGPVAAYDYRDYLHSRSLDSGGNNNNNTNNSAFHPVVSKCSVSETECSTSVPSSSYEVETCCWSDAGDEDHRRVKSCKTRGGAVGMVMGSKLFSGIKGALKSRKRMSGRENPVGLLAEEDEEDGETAAVAASEVVVAGEDAHEMRREFNQRFRSKSDMHSDSDLDEDTMEPIAGQYHLLDEEEDHPRCPSAELGSVEVVAEGTGASLTGLHVLEELRPVTGLPDDGELRPPSVEVMHLEDIPETESPAYHPLIDDTDEGEENPDTMDALSFSLHLAYKSPKPNPSPDHSNKSSNSPHSRTTASGNSQADYEVRETNRRSCRSRNREEVLVDLDGSATVHSSSTSSSNYRVHSPKIREGAMPGERFFAATPSVGEGDDLNLGSLSLGPSGKRDIMERLMQRFPPSSSNSSRSTHSPHTVSSASISNTSSTGSETKKPLKFVAIKKGSESRERGIGAIIKPRISKGERPPMQTFSSYQKPPQSPRKDAVRGGARTPTRTPPPRGEYGLNSGANTPASPPVIVDGPMRGDLNTATKPYGVRRGSGRGMILHPPSSELLYQRSDLQTVTSELTESVAVPVDDDGANDGAQEVVTATDEGGTQVKSVPLITPEKQMRRLHQRWTDPQQPVMAQRKDEQPCQEQNTAVISPDKLS